MPIMDAVAMFRSVGMLVLFSCVAACSKDPTGDQLHLVTGGATTSSGGTGAGSTTLGTRAASGSGGTGAGSRSASAAGGDSGMNAAAGGGAVAGNVETADSDADADGSAGADGDTEPDTIRPPPECSASMTSSAPCRACTHQGLLEGATEGQTCRYLGIPYAKPPVGPLRFAPPEPAEGWTGVRRAIAFGSACVQSTGLSGSLQLGEDCLFINVWNPRTVSDKPLPVMVFIHGGGFNGGATNTNSGLGLSAAGSLVVVSMNYRLGALGFFAHPELDKQRPERPSGSDGIRDQQLALRWVKDNIASFQGDPNKVTVFGASAGSSSVGIHLVSPGSRGLVQRFIMESAVPTRGVANRDAPNPRAKVYELTQELVTALCPTASDLAACLRGLPAQQLMKWVPSNRVGDEPYWLPVVEGPGGVLPDTPDALMERGDFNAGEILVGTNKNEYGLFQLLNGEAVTTIAQLRMQVQSQYPDQFEQIMALYAPDASVDPNQAHVTLMTDVRFRCATRSFARLAASRGRSVYLYSFEQGGAIHSEELTYVFGYGYAPGIVPPVQPLVDAIQGYWTNFARDGSPNSNAVVAWPKYEAASDQHLILADPPASASGLQKAACDFWDTLLAKR